MPFLAALLLFATVQAPERVSWMRPEAYHLTVGMRRASAVEALRAWSPKGGVTPDEVVVDFNGERSITMQFRQDRLVSIRFELFVLLPETRSAFEQARRFLASELGKPRQSGRSVVVYDEALPNVMMVIAEDPESEQGKKGQGVVAIRYFDPR